MTNLEKHGVEARNVFVFFCGITNCAECRFLQFKGTSFHQCYEAWKQEEVNGELK